MALYPLKFEPIFKQRVWGGRRLADLGRRLPGSDSTPIGESWELVDLESDQSRIANGPLKGRSIRQVIAEFGPELLGNLPLMDGSFPMLVKYLDARENLSVQVHPDADGASGRPGCRPKCEAWYILAADEGAVIYKGLRQGLTRDVVEAHIRSGEIVNDLIALPVKPGQCHYLPAGTCHALGAGVVVAEIQTPSDTTFRVYDWGRQDRELHIEAALDCMHYGPPDVRAAEKRSHVAGVFTAVSRLLDCEYFRVEKIRMTEAFEQEIPYDRPAVWIVLEGRGTIRNTPADVDVPFAPPDVILMPAGMADAKVQIEEDAVWLDVQFPPLLKGEVE